MMIKPPIAKKLPHKMKKHGDIRVDPYFWLNQREDKDVLDYLAAENHYVKSIMDETAKAQDKLVAEMRSRINDFDESAPYKRGEFFYFSRYEKGAEYPTYLRRKFSPDGPEQTLLDVQELAKAHKYYDMGRVVVSPDADFLLFAADTIGRRFYNLYFKNLTNGQIFNEHIANTTGNSVWLNDNKTILYTKQDPNTLRAHQVYQYTIGENPILVYEEKDPRFYVSVSKSLTMEYVFINCISNSANEIHFSDAYTSDLDFKVFLKRKDQHEYSVIDGEDRFFIHSNWKAKNFQIFETRKDQLAQKNWQTVIPHNPDSLIEDVLVLKNFIILQERSKGLTQLTHFPRNYDATKISRKGKKRTYRINKKQIHFSDPSYMASFGANAEYESETFRYEYQSLTQPETVFDYDFLNKKIITVKVEKIPNFDSKLYKSERIWAKGHDGVKIPISLVYKKNLFKKGKNPLFIYAYGSYGLSVEAYFRSNVISLLDRGFVFAIAHIRGGSDLGRKWYETGKLLKKKNTFKDFISATEHLLKFKYGQKGRIYAMGGSAGGLLMGAVANMRPDLYNGMISVVPFVDVLTTMLDDSIPLTTNEYEEWGNPNQKKYYQYIKSYSPYDNIKKVAYPNILVTTGFHDSQVQYWEPAKWVAKLRSHNTGDNLILFKTDMTSGHSGITGRYESLKEDALEYAFLLMLEKKC